MTYFRRALAGLLAALPALALVQQPPKLAYPNSDDPRRVFDAVEQPAVPQGGPAAYAAFLQKNQHYPAAALAARQEGTVQVSFVVEKTGEVREAAVAQPGAPALDAEALRLIRASPRWTPAHHQGRAVRQRVTVPVSFVLAGPAETVTVAGPAAPGGATLIHPDRPAQPVGGAAAFFAWVKANQQYPALARHRRVQGRVPVEFTVQPDGSLTDVRVLQKHGSGLDEEAVRLIKAAPKWEPATFQGQPIKQKLTLPVLFQL